MSLTIAAVSAESVVVKEKKIMAADRETGNIIKAVNGMIIDTGTNEKLRSIWLLIVKLINI
jgi:hypothetical protein